MPTVFRKEKSGIIKSDRYSSPKLECRITKLADESAKNPGNPRSAKEEETSMSASRRCSAPRPQTRIWEFIWEEAGEIYCGEIEVSVFITAPEIVTELAQIPLGNVSYVFPRVA